MSKARKMNPADLRTQADAALVRLEEKKSAYDAAIEKKNVLERQTRFGYSHAAQITLYEAEIAMHLAEDEQRVAAAAASFALDAADRVEHDTDALACDPERLRVELAAAHAEEARLVAEHLAARQRSHAVVVNAYAAVNSLSAKRSAAGLPPATNLPPAVDAFGNLDNRVVAAGLAKWEEEGTPAPLAKNEAKINKARWEANKLRATLQEAFERAQARAAQAADKRKDREWTDDENRRLARGAEAAKQAGIQADADREAAQVAAYIKRTAEAAEGSAL